MTNDPNPKPNHRSSGLSAFWAELKRRKVMRVAITYIIASIAIIEFASATFGYFDIPKWAFQMMTLCLVCGFPIAVIIAWAFELTPDGIKTTKVADRERSDASVSEKQQRKRNWFTFLFGAAVPTVIFGALAIYFYATRSDTGGQADVGEKSIAVLPLENMSPDPENAFFADGVQEDILTNLSKIEELGVVISRSSTLKYRDPDRNLKQVGQELGVRYIVEGSVRRATNQVRVTVQLIDSQTDDHLWAENYDRPLDNIFTIQSEIAKQIADQLHAVISPQEIQSIEYRPTDNQEAYDMYAKSRLAGGLERIELLERAVALDPEFAEAWARLSAYLVDWWRLEKLRNDPEVIARAHHALSQVERHGPDLPELPWALSYFARIEHYDDDASIEHLLKALAIDPKFLIARRSLANRYSYQGRLADAQYHYEIALREDPLSPGSNNGLFHTYAYRRNWESARELAETNIRLSDNASLWKQRLANINYLQSGDKEAYIAEMERIPSFIEGPKGLPWNALMLKDFATALQHIDGIDTGESLTANRFQMNVRGTGLWFRPPSLLASLIWREIGDKEKSIQEAQKAIEYLEWVMGEDPQANEDYLSNLMVCYSLIGDREKVLSTIANLQDRFERSHTSAYIHQPYHLTYRGIAYLILGDTVTAIQNLEKASKLKGRIFLNRELDLWFIFDRLRGNPRFDALLKD